MKYGYIRVSTREQDETRQMLAMLHQGIPKENLFIDKSSGANFIEREAWQKLLAALVIGDTICIQNLKRLGRNNQEIKKNFELVIKKGVNLEFLDQPILNTTNRDELWKEMVFPIVLHLLGYIAEEERKEILKRQKEGYEALERDEKGRMISRKKNKVVGRPNKQESLSKEERKQVVLWMEKELKTSTILQNLNISKSTLYRIKKRIEEGRETKANER